MLVQASPAALESNAVRAAVAVEARGLTKLFATTPALIRVDLTVPAAAVVALLGGNGAGKTTLLRVLATSLRPTSGKAHVFGADVTADGRAVRRLIDFLPASGGVYPELTGRENLRFCARMRGSETASTIDGVLACAGLARVADDPARTYSSGMLRRLGLARLMLTRPRLALLDEPYAGLDEEGRELLDGFLGELRARGGSALLATHEQDRALTVADGVCRLERGLVVDAEPPDPQRAASLAAVR